MTEQTLVEKYRPTSIDQLRGNKKEVKQVLEWVKNFENEKKNALLLYGQAGVGKTTLAHLIANELDLELVETNASDVRTKQALKDNLEQAVKQKSFFNQGKLILIDEIDGMTRQDRGGKKVISDIIKETKFPLILTANDEYASGLSSIKRKCKTIEIGKVHTNSIAARLREICEQEGVSYEKKAIKTIARTASGDMRAAINDLESLLHKHDTITGDNVQELGYRNKERDIFQALKIIFKTKTAKNAHQATDNLSEDFEMLFEWVRENVPAEYKKKGDLSRAYDCLSRADIFRAKVKYQQRWKLLKYVYDLISVGVALAKEEKYEGFTRYSFPAVIKQLGRSKSVRKKKEKIAKKIGKRLHTSTSTATADFPLFKQIFEREEWRQDFKRELELEEDEVEFIEKHA